MEQTSFNLIWTVAKLPTGKFIAVCNLGGFTLRGNVTDDSTSATRSLFQLIGGASGYASVDADIAISLALAGTNMEELASGVSDKTP